jgi:hypothetical protein
MNERIEPIRIHPLDLAQIINGTPESGVVDIFVNKTSGGARIVEFPKTGKKYIEDVDAPRLGTDVA